MTSGAPVIPAFDLAAALAQLNNDRQLFDELAMMFIDELPHLLAEINAAISRQSFDDIRRSAHRFKGETLHFVCKPLENCLKIIELAAIEQEIGPVTHQQTQLEPLCQQLRNELLAIMGDE
jgi:HPt (histidine-containing phosphotransfer) domain-containing protein